MLELIGSLGGVLLALSAVPQVWDCIKRGNADGITSGMLWLWFSGCCFMLMYSCIKYSDILLFLNYTCNTIFSGTILFYKHFPRRHK